MDILKRIWDALKRRIDRLVEEARDPEQKVEEVIRGLERLVLAMRRSAAGAMATCRLSHDRLSRARGRARNCCAGAEEALRQGDEELARRALKQKAVLEKRAALLERQTDDADQLTSRMQEAYSSMRRRLEEVRSRRSFLVSQQRLAGAEARMEEALRGYAPRERAAPAISSLLDGLSRFPEFEEDVDRSAAEMEACRELSGEDLERYFERLQRRLSIEDELEAIRRRLEN